VSKAPAGPGRTRGLRWRDAEYASLDFETTGLDLRKDTVVSFGVLPVSSGRILMARAVHQLIDPSVPPSPRSQTIHELRPQDLAGSPRLEEAREALRGALDGRYLLVWFADVELNFLKEIFGGARRTWRRRTIDVRNLAIAADGMPADLRLQPGYGLSATAKRFGVPVANPHEALDDALVTAQLFLVLVGKLHLKRDPLVRDLLRTAGAKGGLKAGPKGGTQVGR
jgi:DNA polymerase-3 subunit epsilon